MPIDASDLTDDETRLLYIYLRLGFESFEEIAGGETSLRFYDAFANVRYELQNEIEARGISFYEIDDRVLRYIDEDDDFSRRDLTDFD